MTERRQFCPRGHDTFQTGRTAGNKKCLACMAEDVAAKDAEVEAAAAEAQAEFERRREEIDRRLEREYQAAIKRGGYDAVMARWDRAYSETIEKTGYGLCQWEDEVDGEFMGRECYRRTRDDIYCWRHNKQLERESARRRREREAAEQ